MLVTVLDWYLVLPGGLYASDCFRLVPFVVLPGGLYMSVTVLDWYPSLCCQVAWCTRGGCERSST